MGIKAKTTGESMTFGETRDRVPQQWYAIRVKSRCEKIAATMAQNRGFEEFLPLYQCRHRWSDRVKSVELPLFPGYIFCRLNPEHRLPLLTIPGVLHLVGIGKIPAPIEDTEISAIQSAVRSGLSAEPWSYLEVGQRVRLEDGPLVGLEGILVEAHKEQRLVVSVTLLRRSVAVAIERHWARPLDAQGRPAPVHLRPLMAASPLSI
jgi:transcription antitermination factor NusG